jgi:hypothetical protein
MNFLPKLLPFIQFSFIAKIGFLALDFFFMLFLIIAVRQVFAMDGIISGSGNSSLVKFAVIALLLIAVSLFLTALVIL